MTRKLLFPFLALALAVLACNLPSKTPVATETPGSTQPPVPTNTSPVPLEPTPTTTTEAPLPTGPTATTNPQPSGGLTVDVLKNTTYHTPYYDRTVKLTDGSYTESSGTYAYTVTFQGAAFGDLNGDGKNDAAVIIAENGGGSGTFISLITFDTENGLPKQTGEAKLGDRVMVKSADISSGVVHLDMVVHGPNDGLCCPSLSEKQNYWLFGNLLFLMRLTTTPTDVERVITINSPAHWSTQNNPFTVEGSVTVLPFENTLGYKIYKIDGQVINQGTVSVTPTVGTAGVFSQSINLSNAGITDWVILQFFDTSAADGSTIALASVILRTR